jgi:lipopolysaccharide biosynthesis glycosyltransferase
MLTSLHLCPLNRADCFVAPPFRELMLIYGVDLSRFTRIARREGTHERLFVPHNFARFALPSLLPNVDKILWIDTDVILQADIAVLFDTMLCDGNYPNSAGREAVRDRARVCVCVCDTSNAGRQLVDC